MRYFTWKLELVSNILWVIVAWWYNHLVWLAAPPDGLVVCETSDKKLLLAVKCPHTKRNMSPIELFKIWNSYMDLENGEPVLKKTRFTGYDSQIQLAKGILGCHTFDFLVYTFKCLIIVWCFHFDSLIHKLSSFYKAFILPRIVSSLTI